MFELGKGGLNRQEDRFKFWREKHRISVGIWMHNLIQLLNLGQISLSCVRQVHYLCKSTESHHMWALCQSMFWSCLVHFWRKISNDYFSQWLLISERYPYSLPNWYPIAITISPWLLPDWYHYCCRLVFPSTWGRPQSHPEMKTFSLTEIPHGRQDQGGTGIKWRHDYVTRSVR